MTNSTDESFVIQRSVVSLKVQLQLNGTVSIKPHNCKESNLRLWHIIARTQTNYAQAKLDAAKTGSPYSILMTSFDKQGWNISKETEI